MPRNVMADSLPLDQQPYGSPNAQTILINRLSEPLRNRQESTSHQSFVCPSSEQLQYAA